jgi:hypothetical protein
VILLSNIFAIFLQSLSIRLGTVTGLNLAEACRAFLPRWLNYALYVLAEVAIIATDIAEVGFSRAKAEPIATQASSLLMFISGHRYSYCTESPHSSSTTCSWMRNFHRRCDGHPHLLPTEWLDERLASVRILRRPTCIGGCDMFLYPALAYSQHCRRNRIPRLSSI